MASSLSANFLPTSSISISITTAKLQGEIMLPSSKSESNRVLIINALCEQKSDLINLSTARDTQTLQTLLQSEEETLDVKDAGTTMRFLTAYCTIKNRPTLLKGTARMHERPIRELVEALRQVGGQITYEQNEGFPPIYIHQFNYEAQAQHIQIKGNISSQYISAVLMIAPLLPKGLLLEILPPVSSEPYIKMTLNLMQRFGILYSWTENRILIPHQQYRASTYVVESDWSAASYWYSMIALTSKSEIFLKGLRQNSLQGDSQIAKIMKNLGVKTSYAKEGVLLQKTTTKRSVFKYNFTDCPDLAQTIAVLCAALGVEAHLTGLHSLKIKETDRLMALKLELEKFGVDAKIKNDNTLFIAAQQLKAPTTSIQTYHDHRMAMAFAPLALLFPLHIEAPDVVAKSYPHFWEDLKKVGFEIELNN